MDHKHRDWAFYDNIIKEYKGKTSAVQEKVVCQVEAKAIDNLYLKNKLKAEDVQKFYIFNSHFFMKLIGQDCKNLKNFEVHEGCKRVKNWTKKMQLFEKDFIIIPLVFNIIFVCHLTQLKYGRFINDSLKVPCISHMDPMKGSQLEVGGIVKSFLLEEWMQRNSLVFEDDMSKKLKVLKAFSPELPQQPNLHDCALFILHYVELFLKQSPLEINESTFGQQADSARFLSRNWFKDEYAVEKRLFTRNLICEFQKTYAT
ncbi:probable ubiquitin-like-specific protease 2B [Rutidosis leptorrhynchoides]|uniref:probable ubiquitin-like-specific protease 2B n=1 Tax=Rutidosis leptorrhynchoides TaxID=125765 RepID=UPI003A992E25